MKERYIAAIDLGSSKIALTVAQVSGEDVRIIYYGDRESNGIKYSAVFIPKKVSAILKELISEAENQLQMKISQVVVNYPKCDIRQETAEAEMTRSNPDDSITEEEVENLKSMAQNDYPIENPETEQLYVAIPQSFSDDENFQLIEQDIIGVISKVFKGHFKLFIGKKSSVRNIYKVFNDMDIAIARLYFTPATIAKAVLTEDEIDNGVALIDMGGGSTSVSIYNRKVLRYYSAIPFGGKSITTDIRTECSISDQLAENIKLAFGVCIPDKLQSLQEKIIQIEDPDMNGYKQIPVQYLSEVITARINEIVQAILYKIEQSGYADKLRNGVVITGGGANLANVANFIKEVSGYNVRTGFPRHLVSIVDDIDLARPDLNNSLGMILTAKNENINCLELSEEYAQHRREKELEEEEAARQLKEAEEKAAEQERLAEPEEREEEAEVEPEKEEPVEEKHESRKEKKEKRKEKKEEPKTFLGIRWRKIMHNINNVTSNINDVTSTWTNNMYDKSDDSEE